VINPFHDNTSVVKNQPRSSFPNGLGEIAASAVLAAGRCGIKSVATEMLSAVESLNV